MKKPPKPRQLAERLQTVLDSPPMESEWEEDISGSENLDGIARNKLRNELEAIIRELMPPQSFDSTDICLCGSCGCMTHTLADGRCGKCKAWKHELMPKDKTDGL